MRIRKFCLGQKGNRSNVLTRHLTLHEKAINGHLHDSENPEQGEFPPLRNLALVFVISCSFRVPALKSCIAFRILFVPSFHAERPRRRASIANH